MDHYVGAIVKNDIINSYGLTLIKSGTKLDRDSIGILTKHQIDLLSIVLEMDHPVGESFKNNDKGFEPLPSMNHVVDASKELFEAMRSSQKVPLMEIRKEIIPFVQQYSENTNVFELFQSVKSTDEYTYQHNIGVGILSALIGRWLNLTEPEITTLSLAATLHDIGKVKVPLELLNKPGKLTDSEFALVKKHAIFGYEILKDTVGLHSRIPLVALQHHERSDGSGYPFGLKADKVDFFSKIVAVADIFHAMSSKRPYHEPIPFYEIINQMRRGTFGELDPNIVSVFLDNIVKRMIGQTIVLSDGQVGEVISLNPHNIETPLIKVNDDFIDMSKRSDLRIKEISI